MVPELIRLRCARETEWPLPTGHVATEITLTLGYITVRVVLPEALEDSPEFADEQSREYVYDIETDSWVGTVQYYQGKEPYPKRTSKGIHDVVNSIINGDIVRELDRLRSLIPSDLMKAVNTR